MSQVKPETNVRPRGDARQALIEEIDARLETATERSRARILEGTARLFLRHADTLDDETLSLFDDVFLRQIDRVGTPALAALAGPIAPVAKPPERLVRALARHASVEVAAPFLARTKSLSDAELQAIARTCGPAHLYAICERAEISDALSAVLIERGDRAAIDRLALNPGAKFTVQDFGALLGRASADERARVTTDMPVAVRGAGGGSVLARCQMIDISPGGAKLKFAGPPLLPEVFVLEFTNVERQHMPCRKVWQRGEIAGLRFVTSLLALWGAGEEDGPIPQPEVILGVTPTS